MSSEFMWELLVCALYGTGVVVLVAVSIAFTVGAYKALTGADEKTVGDINITSNSSDPQEVVAAVKREIRRGN